MIKNQKQAAITKSKLAELLETKKELEGKRADYSPLEYELAENSFNSLINELEEQIIDYDCLVNGNFNCLKPKNIEDIPNILIAARLAQKMSQKDLGEKLGLNEQQIQRYEATDYESASWTRIVEIIFALNIQLYFESIIIANLEKDDENFELPEGYSKDDINNAENKVRIGHCLILN
jgi:transcriptional regulator with XRE-family HTH domain